VSLSSGAGAEWRSAVQRARRMGGSLIYIVTIGGCLLATLAVMGIAAALYWWGGGTDRRGGAVSLHRAEDRDADRDRDLDPRPRPRPRP